MPAREFTITELVSEVLDPYAQGSGAAGVRFVWDARTHTMPAGGWAYGVEQRISRDDPVGGDEPAEQVLGPRFKPFTLRGVWDDKWAGAGYADRTRQEFEQLVQRGNLCRFELENISVVGRISDLDVVYKKKSRVEYSFTVSPHRRLSGGDARRQTRLAPSAPLAPKDYIARAQALGAEVLLAHAQIPALALVGAILADANAAVLDVSDAIAAVSSAIDTRLRLAAPVDGAQRVVQAFTGLRTAASELATLARSYGPTVLAYEAAGPVMALDVWAKSLGSAAARLAFASDVAVRELERRIGPRALALYSPRAGESLYSISLAYFGTPHRWREIADRNYLTRPILDGTELLIIPRMT